MRFRSGVDTFSKASISSTTIKLENAALTYTVDDIVPSIDTGNEATSYLIDVVNNPNTITDRVACKIEKSNNDIIITLNSNWRNFVNDSYKISVYYKQEQVLTERGQRPSERK